MPTRFISRTTIFVALSCAYTLLTLGCGAPPSAPWPSPKEPTLWAHAEVEDIGEHNRRTGRAVIRRVGRATRANLDFAIHHANPIFAAPTVAPEHIDLPVTFPAEPFDGVVVTDSITGSIGQTPLTEQERSHALAFSAAVEWLARENYQLAGGLEDVRGAIRAESWGRGGGPHLVRQQAAELFIHAGEDRTELWVHIEFSPWFDGISRMPDEDGDGVAGVYARVRDGLVAEEAIARIQRDYSDTVLDRAGIETWANEVASYWYPSHNTDLESPGARWPDEATDPQVVASLGGRTVDAPTVVMVGRPHGDAIYNVLLVEGLATAKARAKSNATMSETGSGPTADPEPLAKEIRAELARHGSWESWTLELKPFRHAVGKLLASKPEEIKALIGRDGFLFYRASLRQMTAGDFQAQQGDKNPFAALVEFKEMLAAKGVDFLFVPVPTKSAVFPEKVVPVGTELVGKMVNPYERKLLLELTEAGVEVLDLTSVLLAARSESNDAAVPLYLAQDTHWTDRGLQLAAHAIAERVRRYPWFANTAATPIAYENQPAPFTHRGDLPGRLADADQRRYGPVELQGTQILRPDGELYDDDPDSPITVLGDSFTGVYQRTFCRNAGLSAHLARELGVPVDLVMSYGGGPTVRKKLLRRGREALGTKRIVIWVMAARDLYDFWGAWDPLD